MNKKMHKNKYTPLLITAWVCTLLVLTSPHSKPFWGWWFWGAVLVTIVWTVSAVLAKGERDMDNLMRMHEAAEQNRR